MMPRCSFSPFANRTRPENDRQRNPSVVRHSPRPGSNRRQLAALLGRVLRRLEKFALAFHLVVHTAPNTRSTKGGRASYWKTLAEDFHWHIEILPIVEKRSKSYSIKEVYFNAVLPEEAAEYLRSLDPGS